jgi:DNA-binding XRE family transcriptional regulator
MPGSDPKITRRRPTRDDWRTRARRARQWKEFRRRLLLTQSELARLLNCSKRSVAAIEGAETSPRYPLLRRFRTLDQVHQKEKANLWT